MPPRLKVTRLSETLDSTTFASTAICTIEPQRGWKALDLRELWQYRELLFFLTWRDVKVRYKQTLLGAAWAVLQPLMMMVVFTIFLGRLAGVSSGEFPYPLFVFAGLLPWSFFSTAIANAGNSVVGAERLITKVYFPRLAVPYAAVAAALLDFAIAMCMLLLMMAYYRVAPGVALTAAPLAIGCLALAALGIGSMLAALNVAYRDFRYVIPFLVQVWMFATPSIYLEPSPVAVVESSGSSASVVAPANSPPTAAAADRLGPTLRWVLKLNPITGLVSFFRVAVLGGVLPWSSLAQSAAMSLAMFLAGCFYFRRVEDTFADII